MSKLTAIINFVAGILFALVGVFAVMRAAVFLSAAPRDHVGLIAWAFMIIGVGICLVIGGLSRVRQGTNRSQGPETPEDY
jgi:Na+/H+ antiporter NhaC